ncbi:MAG: Ku protein [Actinomycetota bacterium]|nr:Ku protein [Actinomycetota bacterium]
MRSIWKGAISFGLVTIPVRLYSATEERDVTFHQVHRSDGGRIRYRRVCQLDGEEVSYGDIAKGYELDSGEVVVLTDEDFADLPLSSSRSVEVLQFVPLEQVDPMYFAKSYFLEPDAAGAKPYVLLREALEQSGRVAVVKVALRQRESLACLRVRRGVLVLETMLWPDELRTPDFGFLDEDISVRPQEVTMASSLIEALAGDFAPEQYTDSYREALQQLIEAKVEGREVVEHEQPTEQPGTVVDLMAALRASVDAAKRKRGEDVEPVTAQPSTETSKPAKQAKKQPAKKTSAMAGKTAKTAKTTKANKTSKTASKPARKAAAAKKVAAGPARRTASRRSA